MDVLFVLIPVSIALAAASVVACLVAIRGGQYDDLESPRWRILFDDARADRASEGGEAPRGSGKGVNEDVEVNPDEITKVEKIARARRSDPI
jgi:cbb3-type cytochrome oxidase maturation protein